MTAPEFRRCPISGHQTIFAPDRGRRPIVTGWQGFEQTEPPDHRGAEHSDPFLAGNEDQTAAELLTITGDETWSVRVIENLYPAFASQASREQPLHDLFRSHPAIGHHEVIVECPQFETELANLSASQIADVLAAWQQRLRAIRQEGRFDYAFIFKNSGARAGTSLPHTHSQLTAAATVPDTIQREHRAAREYFEETRRAILDEVIVAERDADRVVIDQGQFIAFCPFASRFAFEACIAPSGSGSFLDLASDATANLAGILHRLLNAFLSEHPGAAYNLLLHATPFSAAVQPWFRWRLELCPRLAQLAGFELGTGWYVNSILPLEAAARMRTHIDGA